MYSGSIVAIVTPMFPDGRIDYDTLEKLVEFHVENKTDAIVAVGTTGESATINFDEHRDVVKRMVAFANGRIPIIAGTGGNSTEEAIRLTHWAAEDGAEACLLVTPYYNRPPQEGLYQHYRLIAETVDIPQILYNVPSRCGCDLLPETVERLCEFDNIVAIKEASTLERVEQLVRRVGDKIAVFSGEDGLAAESVLAGAKGVISVTANIAPLQMHNMIHAALEGDREKALALDKEIAELHHVLFLQANPIPVKWALQRMGKIQPGIRLPLVPLDKQFHLTVEEALRKVSLI
ncbi:4-hydroxy-tetrahydrodipicolinate synthase [Ignatzschineria sp. RMDPL8A]|uniref:4-hydroxy-tetrahydrodipicolinate synthase n=1 Tax=Ignatzschineria sp. RMDPL8A TaxID=2999236 RepID=UPI0016B05EEE|nr:4-hydroxy-tetrahydrodipicolinate synthase [Ignatzschineria sp. RMDPL8A]MDG9729957.1 4-hydroxy-tetrahydrodipicolinate synthase [Ignatzschineria sp. RMDPL8A]NLD09270.1 4-hydroxy-tetrahydrodipicolinate synthase [Xanthomonadaceae bacterium]